MRRWRQQGPRRHAEAWFPAGVVDDLGIATGMAELIEQSESETEARVLSGASLLRELRAEDRDRILELLNNRTRADVERAAALRHEAIARRAGLPGADRRSGRDRRAGGERRAAWTWHAGDRRSGADRRSGLDRRRVGALVA